MSAEDDKGRNPSLGEINRLLRLERGDVYRDGAPVFDAPTDVQANRVVREAEQGPSGLNVPGYPGRVQPTYDARPINAVDFWRSTQYAPTAGDNPLDWIDLSPPEDLIMEFTIPEGVVAVIKKIRWQFFISRITRATGFVSPQNDSEIPLITVRVDGIVQSPFRQNNSQGIDTGEGKYSALSGMGSPFRDVYIPVETGSTVSLYAGNLYGDSRTYGIKAEVYGQFLLSRGYPANFEPAIF